MVVAAVLALAGCAAGPQADLPPASEPGWRVLMVPVDSGGASGTPILVEMDDPQAILDRATKAWEGLVAGGTMGLDGPLVNTGVYPDVTGCWFLRTEPAHDWEAPGVPHLPGMTAWPTVTGNVWCGPVIHPPGSKSDDRVRMFVMPLSEVVDFDGRRFVARAGDPAWRSRNWWRMDDGTLWHSPTTEVEFTSHVGLVANPATSTASASPTSGPSRPAKYVDGVIVRRPGREFVRPDGSTTTFEELRLRVGGTTVTPHVGNPVMVGDYDLGGGRCAGAPC